MSLSQSINDPNFIIFTSGIISVTASSLILRFILTGKRVKRMYNRLVLGLATVDLLYTLQMAIFAVTIRTKDRQTGPACSYEGFVHTALVLPSIYYNGFLSIYFVFTICDNKRDLVQRIEPYAHVFCLGLPILVGLLGVGLGIYGPGNPDDYSCWIFLPNDPPLVCESDGTGCSNAYSQSTIIAATFLQWFQVVSGIVVFCLLFVNSYRIYLQARKLEDANKNYILPIQQVPATQAARGTLSQRTLSQPTLSQQTPGHKNVIQIIQQSFLYVGGFIMIYFWILVLNIAQTANPVYWGPDSDYMPAQIMRLLFDTFYPLSGLYTAAVFFRPRFLRWRNKNQRRSWFFVFRMTVFSLDAPQTMDCTSDRDGDLESAQTSSFMRWIIPSVARSAPPSDDDQSGLERMANETLAAAAQSDDGSI
jgi:hypothetical protein